MALIKFLGIDTPEAAGHLWGTQLEVPLGEVPLLSPDNYYHFQILDMVVWTQDGECLGVVEDIVSTGSNDVYVVRHGKHEVLVPALKHVIVDVDLVEGRITVDLPRGLR